MGKFDKKRRLEKRHQVEPDLPMKLEVDDPLLFQVYTTGGRIRRVDLRRFRDGDAERGIAGNETLILDLLPYIKEALDGVRPSPKAIDAWIARRLPPLFKFATELEVEIGVVLRTACDFSNEDGVVLKEFLLLEELNPVDRRKYFTAIHSLLREARGPTSDTLHWPDMNTGPDVKLHEDVNPAALKEIYHLCKRILVTADQNRRNGEEWQRRGIRPDRVPFEPVRKAGQRGSVPNEAWVDEANLSVLARDVIRQRVTGKNLVCRTDKARFLRHTTATMPRYSGIRTSDAYAANAPTSLEVVASVLIVSMETGWIDAISGIDLSSKWYTLRRGDDVDDLGKTDSVVLHSTRPKTSKELTAIGLAGARFRSFRIIRDLQRRTEFLRACLLERRAILERGPQSAASIEEIAEIDFRLRSPWLFFNSKRTGVKAVGIFDSSTMYQNLKVIKSMAIAALSHQKKDDDELVGSIQSFRWSDARDAFAAHLYEKSGGNIFLVQKGLNHNDVSVTRHYLRQKRMLKERFDAFRKVMQAILDELHSGQMLDPTVLFLRLHQPDFGAKDLENLGRYRTRMGMGCLDPTSPSTLVAPGHSTGKRCTVQRCILCRNGVIFTDAFDGLAKRHAELQWLRRNSNAMRWLTSTFAWELEAIELARDEVFTDQITQFNDQSNEYLKAIDCNESFVFDEPELRGLLSS